MLCTSNPEQPPLTSPASSNRAGFLARCSLNLGLLVAPFAVQEPGFIVRRINHDTKTSDLRAPSSGLTGWIHRESDSRATTDRAGTSNSPCFGQRRSARIE